MRKISIIHPTKSRPKRSSEILHKWISRSTRKDFELIIVINWDDPFLEDYRTEFDKLPLETKMFIKTRANTAVGAINFGAEFASHDIMMVVSDDTDCPNEWDTYIYGHVAGHKDFVLKTQDGIQPWIITMPVMDKAYYDRFGYIYFPEYQHMFCDTELTAVADILERKITCAVLFPHLHYSIKGFPKDALSAHLDSTWQQGEQLYLKRHAENFGLLNAPGTIQHKPHLKWVQSKLNSQY